MGNVDWINLPLRKICEQAYYDENGRPSKGGPHYPPGKRTVGDLLNSLSFWLEEAYGKLVPEEAQESLEWEQTGHVPVVRDGQWTSKHLDTLTLSDLPDVLNTFVVYEHELEERNRKEAERKAAERRNRNRIRAKERRKLKNLGEW